jgi:DNA polymerase-3 subunit gamma/tau
VDSYALKYRPRRFDDLVGQHAAQVILRQMVTLGRVPSALIFDGSRGTGKTTTARILAAALNCDEPTGKPCGTCVSCKATFDGSSMDVLEIDAASNGLVDNIRDLRQQVMYRNQGAYRVVILDEAHSMSHAAFNALLKTLEEPPPQTVFILCTTEPQKIPNTVASRCMPFTFRRLAVADIAQRLAVIAQQEGVTVEDGLLMLLAERADGAMRDAIMLLDQVARVGMSTAEQYQRLIGHTDSTPAIINALIARNLSEAFSIVEQALMRLDAAVIAADLTALLRDALVLRSGGEVTKTGVALAARQNLALTLEAPALVAALKILWEFKTKVRIDDNRQMLDLAIVMLAETLAPHLPAPAPAAPARMTLSQMVQR